MLEYNIFSWIFDEGLVDDIPCILYFYISKRIHNEFHNARYHCVEEPSTNNVTKRGLRV